MHRNLLSTIVIDAPSDVHDQTAAFWTAALGATLRTTRMPNYRILEDASPPNRIVVQDVGSGPAGVHLDIHTDDLEAEVERLEKCGATVVDRSWADHPGTWIIMRDPAGTEFCVVAALTEVRRADHAEFERRARPVGRGE
ncbi:VOC family protein [Actinomadura sp. 7K507]|uniref:VOC family protein n=1 Tax=Actinomadura sp. 7K507 TaxID=2530365 RepID=UPI0010457B63|nr:VOC family protein [Actinomadura sp. 7K507]TDC98399.1 glyoxalase/bleomycin resistance/dioxygenase family protein [Actinomadura sp. 7K507]